MFGRVIGEITSGIGKMGGGLVEAPPPTGMPADGSILYPGGVVTNEFVLGVLEEKRFEGQAAASNALALNRMAATPESPLQRSSSSDRRRNLDERLRRLGIGVANR
jgi:hypothetical protein